MSQSTQCLWQFLPLFFYLICTYCKLPVNPLHIKEEAAMYKILSCLPNHKSPLKAKKRLYKVGVINILQSEEFKTRRKQTTIKCYGTDTNTPTSLKLNIELSQWSCSPDYNHQHQVHVYSFQREVSL